MGGGVEGAGEDVGLGSRHRDAEPTHERKQADLLLETPPEEGQVTDVCGELSPGGVYAEPAIGGEHLVPGVVSEPALDVDQAHHQTGGHPDAAGQR